MRASDILTAILGKMLQSYLNSRPSVITEHSWDRLGECHVVVKIPVDWKDGWKHETSLLWPHCPDSLSWTANQSAFSSQQAKLSVQDSNDVDHTADPHWHCAIGPGLLVLHNAFIQLAGWYPYDVVSVICSQYSNVNLNFFDMMFLYCQIIIDKIKLE